MANLNHLVVHNAPKAFSQLAEAHNELVRLIATMEGALGIDIQVAHSPRRQVSMPPEVAKPKSKPRGKILVSSVPTALDGYLSPGSGGGSGSANTLHFNDGTTAIDIDGTYGVAVNNLGVGISTQIFPSGTFQSVNLSGTRGLKYSPNTGVFGFTDGNITVNMAASFGVQVANHADGSFSTLDAAHAVIQRDASNYVEMFGVSIILQTQSNSIYMNEFGASWQVGGGPSASIQYANITHEMSIKTINVCVGNVAKQMLVFGSDPF